MVHFGRHLREEARPTWLADGLYLDYHQLKSRLKDIMRVKDKPETQHLVDSFAAVFQAELDANIAKVLHFYEQRARELQALVEEEAQRCTQALREVVEAGRAEEWAGWRRSAELAAQLDARMEAVQELANEVTHLLRYISLNLAAVRKILKKYSKHAELQAPIPGYLTLEIEHPHDPDWHILQGSFLPASVAEELAQMQQHEEVGEAGEVLRRLYEDLSSARRGLKRQASMRLPSYGEDLMEQLEQLLGRMQEARDMAARNAALVHPIPWAERMAGMFEPPPPDEFATATTSGLVINNLSTLLYMMNYNAIIPPIDQLCVDIGVSGAWTGYIVGASDAAAVFASVGVSYWTNRSFKQPLLLSACCCLAGNLLYCLSYEWHSLPLLLGARLLNGLGSARSANRRYTADYVSRARRTMASAAFVGCSNLGQALGPFLSLPLAALPAGLSILGLSFNAITAVGWIMAAAWLAFLVITLFAFSDPPKRVPIGLAAAAPESQSEQSEASQPLLLNAPDYSGQALTGEAEAEADGELTQLSQRRVSAGAPAGPAEPAGPHEGASASAGASNAVAASGMQQHWGVSRCSEGGAGSGLGAAEAGAGAGVGAGAGAGLGAAGAGRDTEETLGWAPTIPGTAALGKEASQPQGAGCGKPSSSSISHSWPKLAARHGSPRTPRSPLSALTPRSWGGSPRSTASGGSRGGSGAQQAQQEGYSWRATISATAACTACLFVQKAVQQGYLDGVPLVTSVLFRWGNGTAGMFLASIGLAGVPVNLAVGLLSAYVSDRSLVVAALMATLAGLALLVMTTAGAAFYFAGGVTLFIGTVVLEGTATSLMSKVIHPRFAKGTLNAGLLSTEAGTLGRFAGNALLSVTGRLAGVGSKHELASFSWILNSSLAAACAAVLAYLAVIFGRLSG